MKIRTDFVTNSSSSSFIVELSVILKSGEEIIWVSDDYCCESNGELSVNVSPKQLAECNSIAELIQLLRNNVREERINPSPLFPDSLSFVRSLRTLSSMDEIREIQLNGNITYRNEDEYLKRFTYNLEEKKYKILLEGEFEESEGDGGDFYFDDCDDAIVEADSDTVCYMIFTLLTKDGAKKKYEVISCREVEHYNAESNSVVLLNIEKEIKSVESVDQLKSLLNKFLYIDGKRVELGEMLLTNSKSDLCLKDISLLSLELNDFVLGEHSIGCKVIQIKGRTTYEYSFEDKAVKKITDGHIFEHSEGAVVEIVPSLPDEIKESSDNSSVSNVGKVSSISPDDIYHFVTVRFSPKGKKYDYLCEDRSVKAGDHVEVESYFGTDEVEVLEVSDKRLGDLPIPFEQFKKVLRKIK